ncbi:hypothetical protein BC938DRAFT_474858 [Jimgerdemannia flammicorona]|uniref:Uncharacterized protein n=1 Tax=Jimgerdemannia flammicorona TaxID=994334 RepID=A0A433Q1I0_9FUNG|nr:hypothetical protein BC938DRAFT_474858 [Jimgerdemannia flammicorona]
MKQRAGNDKFSTGKVITFERFEEERTPTKPKNPKKASFFHVVVLDDNRLVKIVDLMTMKEEEDE